MRKLSKRIVTTGLIIGSLSVSALAANYTAYTLPAFGGDNHTGIHTKTSNAGYITNTVTTITDASTVNFWAMNTSKERISPKYGQKLGNTTNITFSSTGYNNINRQVGMGMENANVSTSRAWVSGDVNFR